MSELLRCEGVAAELGGARVLRGVDLSVARGEVLGLLGRNGAGKTTLLRVATRVLRPSAGRCFLDGRPLESFARRELASRVAVVAQESFVPFPFRAAEIVLMGRAPRLGLLGFETARDVEIARRAMERVGIAALAERSVLTLSGGERQLVMLARALAQEPELLLLDEATAFLDLRHRMEVLNLVRELARAGTGALVVSHDPGLAARTCDRLALLADGRVLASGAPREVLTPERLRVAFGVEADIAPGPDGTLLVIPRLARAPAPAPH